MSVVNFLQFTEGMEEIFELLHAFLAIIHRKRMILWLANSIEVESSLNSHYRLLFLERYSCFRAHA